MSALVDDKKSTVSQHPLTMLAETCRKIEVRSSNQPTLPMLSPSSYPVGADCTALGGDGILMVLPPAARTITVDGQDAIFIPVSSSGAASTVSHASQTASASTPLLCFAHNLSAGGSCAQPAANIHQPLLLVSNFINQQPSMPSPASIVIVTSRSDQTGPALAVPQQQAPPQLVAFSLAPTNVPVPVATNQGQCLGNTLAFIATTSASQQTKLMPSNAACSASKQQSSSIVPISSANFVFSTGDRKPESINTDGRRASDANRQRAKRTVCSCPNCIYNRFHPHHLPKRANHICHFENCGKTYGKTSHLRAHIRWHNNDKPFKCDFNFCTRMFTRSDELQRHRRTHTGIKNFQCNACAKRFLRSDHLQKHKKTHKNLVAVEPLAADQRSIECNNYF